VIKFAVTAVALFAGVALVHFFLSFFGLALALRVAFDPRRSSRPCR